MGKLSSLIPLVVIGGWVAMTTISSCKPKAEGGGETTPDGQAAAQLPGGGSKFSTTGGATIGSGGSGGVANGGTPVPTVLASPVATAETTPAPTGTPLTLTDRHVVFVSSERYDGNLGGLTGGDMKCQTLATKANLGGTWKAILSGAGSKEAAKDRVKILMAVRNIKGDLLAGSMTDFWAGRLSTAVAYDETAKGPPVGPDAADSPQITNEDDRALALNFVWSGTDAKGKTAGKDKFKDNNCKTWTSNEVATKRSQSKGSFGRFDQSDVQWIRRYPAKGGNITDSLDCSRKRHLYCISQ